MPPEPSHAPPARRYVFIAIKLAVSVALLALLFSRIDAATLWASARQASVEWLTLALTVYFITVLVSVWRWSLLLEAQHVQLRSRQLLGSYLVALFFNNFLPSNIGGDVIRIGSTAKAAGSKTLATIIVLVDRAMGLMGLVLVAACGASMAVSTTGRAALPVWPSWLWAGFLISLVAALLALWSPESVGGLLKPLTVLHPEWVGGRIENITATLARFKRHPVALLSCFAGATFVQLATVAFYLAVASSLKVHISVWDLAVLVPVSGVVQMLPVSLNGFGVREATFSLYFTRLGLPIESALLLSLCATALVMLFSLSGAAVYVARGHQ
jgi:glycosyltransferase 2 family protein